MFDTQQSYLKPFCNKIDFLGKLWPISGNAQTLEFATQWDLVQGRISNCNQSSETIYTLVHTRGQGSRGLRVIRATNIISNIHHQHVLTFSKPTIFKFSKNTVTCQMHLSLNLVPVSVAVLKTTVSSSHFKNTMFVMFFIFFPCFPCCSLMYYPMFSSRRVNMHFISRTASSPTRPSGLAARHPDLLR